MQRAWTWDIATITLTHLDFKISKDTSRVLQRSRDVPYQGLTQGDTYCHQRFVLFYNPSGLCFPHPYDSISRDQSRPLHLRPTSHDVVLHIHLSSYKSGQCIEYGYLKLYAKLHWQKYRTPASDPTPRQNLNHLALTQ